jgi:hypothetical protein
MPKKPSAEFENFDRVMNGLLAVPYSELQKKIEEEKAKKQKKRAKTSPASRASVARKS